MTGRWRHKKRGSTYEVIGTAEIQAASPIAEGQTVVVYRSEGNGTLWVRPRSEFLDGRFEEIGSDGEPIICCCPGPTIVDDRCPLHGLPF